MLLLLLLLPGKPRAITTVLAAAQLVLSPAFGSEPEATSLPALSLTTRENIKSCMRVLNDGNGISQTGWDSFGNVVTVDMAHYGQTLCGRQIEGFQILCRIKLPEPEEPTIVIKTQKLSVSPLAQKGAMSDTSVSVREGYDEEYYTIDDDFLTERPQYNMRTDTSSRLYYETCGSLIRCVT